MQGSEREAGVPAFPHQTQRTLLDWLRVEYAVEKASNKLLAATELDSDNWVCSY